MTHAVEPSRTLLREHQVNYYLHLIECHTLLPDGQECRPYNYSGIKFPYNELVWIVTEEEKEEAGKFLEENKIESEDTLIGISPGGTYGTAKRWFPKSFANVVKELIKKESLKILLFGRTEEKNITHEISRDMKDKCVDLAGKTSLRQLGALLSRCKLLITNDSGAMHISAAVKTPVVAIFGSTDPERTGPWGEGHTVLYKKLDCSPCFARKCPHGDYRCFKEIGVEEIVSAVEEKLKSAT